MYQKTAFDIFLNIHKKAGMISFPKAIVQDIIIIPTMSQRFRFLTYLLCSFNFKKFYVKTAAEKLESYSRNDKLSKSNSSEYNNPII